MSTSNGILLKAVIRRAKPGPLTIFKQPIKVSPSMLLNSYNALKLECPEQSLSSVTRCKLCWKMCHRNLRKYSQLLILFSAGFILFVDQIVNIMYVALMYSALEE